MHGPSGPEWAAQESTVDRRPVSRSRPLEDVSFGAVMDVDGAPRVQWATPDGFETVGCGTATRFEANGADRFERVRSQAAAFFDALEYEGPRASRPRAFGGFAFHDGHDGSPPWDGFAAASFVVPRIQVTRTDDSTWVTTVAASEREAETQLDRWGDRLASLPAMRPSTAEPGVASTTRRTSREAWTDGVETALERIERASLEKVVLAQTLAVDLESPIDVAATLERLRRRYPGCYRFLVDPGPGGTFFGAPPERLVSMDGDRIETEALAGSVPRGKTPEADDAHAERLGADEKFDREHGLVVRAIRDQLEPFASVRVGDRNVRRLATIQHLRTPIEATVEGDRHVLDVVEALHPTPAVGGLPPNRAWETIQDVESFDRGWYAAPIGWFDGDGDGEFAVAIRSGLAAGRRVTLFAGNGIVAEGDPAEEWTEVQLKFRPILDELR